MKLYLITAKDKDLYFIKKHIFRPITVQLSDIIDIKSIEVGTINSKEILEDIQKNEDDAIICFFLHGNLNQMFCSTATSRIEQNNCIDRDPIPFITNEKMFFLKGKKVVGFSCSSNKMSKDFIKNGIRVFMGFDEIPFKDYEDSNFGNKNEQILKQLIASSFANSFIIFIKKELNFNEFKTLLEQNLRKKIFLNPLKLKLANRNKIAKLIQKLISGIKIFGDGNLKFNQ